MWIRGGVERRRGGRVATGRECVDDEKGAPWDDGPIAPADGGRSLGHRRETRETSDRVKRRLAWRPGKWTKGASRPRPGSLRTCFSLHSGAVPLFPPSDASRATQRRSDSRSGLRLPRKPARTERGPLTGHSESATSNLTIVSFSPLISHPSLRCCRCIYTTPTLGDVDRPPTAAYIEHQEVPLVICFLVMLA